jgi:hypothetical protein
MTQKINPYVYFVEHKDSHLWIPEKGKDETANPIEAKLFLTIESADKYIEDNQLEKWFYSTEHEFVDCCRNTQAGGV